MPENWIAARARVMTGLIESISLYGGVCLSCGGLAVLASHAFHANPLLWFTAAFALPIGPLYYYLSSGRVMEARLARWKRWKDEGLIGVGQYEQLRKDALAWYTARHFPLRSPSAQTPGSPPRPVPLPPSRAPAESAPPSED